MSRVIDNSEIVEVPRNAGVSEVQQALDDVIHKPKEVYFANRKTRREAAARERKGLPSNTIYKKNQ